MVGKIPSWQSHTLLARLRYVEFTLKNKSCGTQSQLVWDENVAEERFVFERSEGTLLPKKLAKQAAQIKQSCRALSSWSDQLTVEARQRLGAEGGAHSNRKTPPPAPPLFIFSPSRFATMSGQCGNQLAPPPPWNPEKTKRTPTRKGNSKQQTHHRNTKVSRGPGQRLDPRRQALLTCNDKPR